MYCISDQSAPLSFCSKQRIFPTFCCKHISLHLLSFVSFFKKPMGKLLFTLLLLLSTLGLNAQTPTHVHYGTNQGVPSSQVYHLIQDRKGIIWLATGNGVSCCNGYDFRTLGVTDGLHSQVIFRIFEGHKGRIWFSNSSNTLSYFYNDSIFAYKFNHLLPEHPYSDTYKASLKSVFVDSADNVFV